jgi:hypothetical protein
MTGVAIMPFNESRETDPIIGRSTEGLCGVADSASNESRASVRITGRSSGVMSVLETSLLERVCSALTSGTAAAGATF